MAPIEWKTKLLRSIERSYAMKRRYYYDRNGEGYILMLLQASLGEAHQVQIHVSVGVTQKSFQSRQSPTPSWQLQFNYQFMSETLLCNFEVRAPNNRVIPSLRSRQILAERFLKLPPGKYRVSFSILLASVFIWMKGNFWRKPDRSVTIICTPTLNQPNLQIDRRPSSQGNW